MANDSQPQEDQPLETAKFYMELFKQIGTLSLAGSVLTLALYRAFGTPAIGQTIAAFVGVVAFALSLVASVVGMWLSSGLLER